MQLGLLLLTVPEYAGHGLKIDWMSGIKSGVLIFPLLLFALWLHYKKKGAERSIVGFLLAMLLIKLVSIVTAITQYSAVAMQRPLVDPYLAKADGFLGISVPEITAWGRMHPKLLQFLGICYLAMIPEIATTVLLLAMLWRDWPRLWEYVFHFHFCLIGAVVILFLFPAEGVFTHHGFTPSIDWTRFSEQFHGFRSGQMRVIHLDDLEGLISMPSFHTTVGMIVTWAMRGRIQYLAVFGVLNLGLVACTVVSGSHYFVDLVAAALLFGASLLLFRKAVVPLSLLVTNGRNAWLGALPARNLRIGKRTGPGFSDRGKDSHPPGRV
jgi:hypothetical protein